MSITATINYKTLPGIADMQTFSSDDTNRVMCSNTIIKSFIPVEIQRLEIVYDKNYMIDKKAWTSSIAAVINNWSSSEAIPFSALLENFPAPYRQDEIYADNGTNFPFTFDSDGIITGINATATSYPCYAKIRMNNIDGSSQTYISTNRIAPRYTKAGLSSSYRTCRYVIDPLNIVFTAGSW